MSTQQSTSLLPKTLTFAREKAKTHKHLLEMELKHLRQSLPRLEHLKNHASAHMKKPPAQTKPGKRYKWDYVQLLSTVNVMVYEAVLGLQNAEKLLKEQTFVSDAQLRKGK